MYDNTPPYDVFVSYSRGDKSLVRPYAVKLRDELGFRVWFDEWLMIPGMDFQDQLVKGMNSSKCAFLFVGPNADARWREQEANLANNKSINDVSFRPIPVLLSGGNPDFLSGFLNLKHRINVSDYESEEEVFIHMHCAIKGIPREEYKGKLNRVAAKESYIPRPVDHFVEQADTLNLIRQRLAQHGVAVLCGGPGLGKTQCAAKYIESNEHDYARVWWIKATSRETLFESCATIAERLNLPAKDQSDQQTLFEFVVRWFNRMNSGSGLLIFDNVNSRNFDLVQHSLSNLSEVHVMITTQMQPFPWYEYNPIELTKWDKQSAIQFVRDRLPNQVEGEWDKLAELHDYYPLALAEAVATIGSRPMKISEYLTLFSGKLRKTENLKIANKEYGMTLQATFELSLDNLVKDLSYTKPLVLLFSLLDGNEIPEYFFTQKNSIYEIPENVGRFALKPSNQVLLRSTFTRGSLVLLRDNTDLFIYSMHQEWQIAARNLLSGEAKTEYLKCAASILYEHFPKKPKNPRFWSECARLTPHVFRLIEHWEGSMPLGSDISKLLQQCAKYLQSRSELSAALEMLKRVEHASATNTDTPGQPDLSLRTALYRNLFKTYMKLKDFSEALKYCELVETNSLGNDPLLARAYIDKAELYMKIDRPKEALMLCERALDLHTEHRSSNSIKTYAYSMLGRAQACNDNDTDAEKSLIKSREILNDKVTRNRRLDARKRLLETLGKQEDVEDKIKGQIEELATCLGYLGPIQRRLGRFKEAEETLSEAVNIYELEFGPMDIRIVQPLINTARNIKKSSDKDHDALLKAEALLRRCLEIIAAQSNPNEAKRAEVLGHLASILNLLSATEQPGVARTEIANELQEAKSTIDEALSIYERCYGPKSRQVAIILGDAAKIYKKFPDHLNDAEKLIKRSIEIRIGMDGENSIFLSGDYLVYARVLKAKQDKERALEYYYKAKSIRVAEFGPSHPETIRIDEEIAHIDKTDYSELPEVEPDLDDTQIDEE